MSIDRNERHTRVMIEVTKQPPTYACERVLVAAIVLAGAMLR